MRLTLLLTVPILALGIMPPCFAGERPVLHAVAKRTAGGAFVYGDGDELRRVPPAAGREWRG